MNRKRRYQQGTLTRTKSAAGIAWQIRFVDHTPGNPRRPLFYVGTLAEFPTPAAASRAAQPIRDTFNASPNLLQTHRRTFGDLIDRYLDEELPPAYSTARNYKKMLRVHIRPRWGSVTIDEIKPFDVRTWLKALTVEKKNKTVPMSTRYRGHLHDMMRQLFRFGMLWEWVPPAQLNPMSLFSLEGSSRRANEPEVISVAQFKLILARVDRENFRLMLIAVMCLGLRVSELLALKWEDFDFEHGILQIKRGTVEGHVGEVKTIHSKKPLPLDRLLAQAFHAWRLNTAFPLDGDWVFANGSGGNPYQSSTIQTRVLIPAGKAIGLTFSLGWHTFRHSYKSWMDGAKVQLTVQRDLMRHADIRTTAQVYGKVRLEDLREANSDVVRLVMEDILFDEPAEGNVN